MKQGLNEKPRLRGLSVLPAAVCGALILAADQITKYWISTHFALGESAPFLKGLIEFSYIHNRGGAWGMLSGKTAFLLILTFAIMVLCIVLLIRFGAKSRLLLWAIVLVLAGGIGNMIDRIVRDGNVVDFLHFEFFPSFPVFNVADCAIVVGAGLLILYFLLDAVKKNEEPHADD